MPPSGAPTRPSALSGPCQTSFHLRPPAITPGISVVVTSLAGVGCRNSPPPPPARCCCCCARVMVLKTRADPKQKVIAPSDFNLITPPNGLVPEPGEKLRMNLRQYIPERVRTANVRRGAYRRGESRNEAHQS